MDATIEKLLQIQDRDTRIATLHKQVESVPLEKKQVEAEIAQAEAGLAVAKEEVMNAEKAIKATEMEIQALQARKLDLQAKSYQIKKNDEYRAMLREIEAFDEKISVLETRQLQVMENVDAAKEKRRAATKVFEATKSRLEGTISDLEVRATNCREQAKKVEADRDELAKAIPEDLLRLYRRLTQRPNADGSFRRGVAPLVDNNCGNCFLKVTPQVRHKVLKDEIVCCENCGVMLYNPA